MVTTYPILETLVAFVVLFLAGFACGLRRNGFNQPCERITP
jgi:hypothetical protein